MLELDKFEAWIRDCASGCIEQCDIDNLVVGELDSESGWFVFNDPGVQGQWESWQEGVRQFA